ncbi:MAG: hypothetical protein O7C67_06260 [Gammaproteobacteria bacterium]|nr:hypothetical protein [Gammaproteobacteria bacterium]
MSRMEDRYRLVFRGEILEGQHSAVVKKRIGKALKLTEDKLDELFSGKAVVIAKNADARKTAKLQGTFKEAGARLRALRVEVKAAASKSQAAEPAPSSEASGSIDILPVGSDVLNPDERANVAPADIDTAHLAIDEAETAIAGPSDDVTPPDVSHITVAEVGEDLSEAQTQATVEINIDFEVAELGSRVGDPQDEPEPVVDVDELDFDLAEPGVTILEQQAPNTAPQPNTSHIQLDRE